MRPEVVPGVATFLFSERGVTALQAPALERLAPLLADGADLATLHRHSAAGDAPADQVVGQLARRGLVRHRDAGPAGDRPELAYWESAGLDAAQVVDRIAHAQVRLVSAGAADGTAVRAALLGAGLSVAGAGSDPASADLTVVVCDDYLADDLARIDAAQRAAGAPWLLAKPGGSMLWIGPVLQPGTGGCWHCLAHRLWGHRGAEAYVQERLGRRGPVPRPAASLPGLGGAGAQLVAHAAARWIGGHRAPDQSAVWTLDTLTMAGRHHELRARPQCPHCGDPGLMARQADRPVEFTSRRKAMDGGSGHRSRTPQEVLTAYGHLVSPVTGVVKEIRRVRQGPASLNSFVAGSNSAAGSNSLQSLRAGLRCANGGKGTTPLHAEVSALCEALERHSGHFHGDERVVRATLRALGDAAVHPDTCQLYDPRQFAGRADWNAGHSLFQQVPEVFDEGAEVDWTPVWSVTGNRHRYVPTSMLYYNTPDSTAGSAFFRADSNGAAAGTSLEDAVLQGFLELVERDAVALWWYNRSRLPGIDLESCEDPFTAEFRSVHASLNRETWALDLTSDLGIPVVAAFSRRTDKAAEDITFGFGAHFDPRIALRRALTEVNQLLPAVVEARPDGTGYTCDDPEAMRWWTTATTADQPYLLPDPDVPARRGADVPYTPYDDLAQDLDAVRQLCDRHGLELLVLDQTRPDIGLPVVKVIVPGLRHFWARFAPGRLYDVPVALGRRAEPVPYELLNPVPLFV
ncbi:MULTISPECIES: TOMM precursor leader peptide-binding protein [unclassified Streptomyces]|uniref:TOMM precursor leader peptide-binding protein n=2 Tax=unclassified Streptomyces TaxID=2593676 RepID=UPI000A30DCFD|nr:MULTISPECIES: TOMM precursor leader peptide-binding protein [unclassified Streptomyces]